MSAMLSSFSNGRLSGIKLEESEDDQMMTTAYVDVMAKGVPTKDSQEMHTKIDPDALFETMNTSTLGHSRIADRATRLFVCKSCQEYPRKKFKSFKIARKHIKSIHRRGTKPKFLLRTSFMLKNRQDFVDMCKLIIICRDHPDFRTKDIAVFNQHVQSHTSGRCENDDDPVVSDKRCKKESGSSGDVDLPTTATPGIKKKKKKKKKNNNNNHSKENATVQMLAADVAAIEAAAMASSFYPSSSSSGGVQATVGPRGRPQKEPRECPYCNQLRVNLEQHLKIHSHEKPFFCHQCPYTAKRKSNVVKHLLVHSDYMAYSCTFCDKMFKTGFDLTKHYKIHTGEKNFECELCSKCFRLKHHLKRHFSRCVLKSHLHHAPKCE